MTLYSIFNDDEFVKYLNLSFHIIILVVLFQDIDL